MATSFLSYNLTSLHHVKNTKISQTPYAFDPLCHDNKCSFSGNGGLQSLKTYHRPATEHRLKRDLAVFATSEAAEAAASFLPSLPTDIPWYAWAGCLVVGLPLAVQRLINLSNQVEAVAETVETIADTVGNVASQIDKAADEMIEKLPDGTFKNIVDKVEDIAEATAKEAQRVEDLMDKVEEVSNKVEDFLVETSKKQPAVKVTTTGQK